MKKFRKNRKFRKRDTLQTVFWCKMWFHRRWSEARGS